MPLRSAAVSACDLPSQQRARTCTAAFAATTMLVATPAAADENLFGYTYGAETLPKEESEAYHWITDRRDKGQSHYDAPDYQIDVWLHALLAVTAAYFGFVHHDRKSEVSDSADR